MIAISKSSSIYLAALLIALVFAPSAEAKHKMAGCERDYRLVYLPEAIHGAFATTSRRNPLTRNLGMSCGRANGYDTKAQAIHEALRQCRISDRKYHDVGECKIFAVK